MLLTQKLNSIKSENAIPALNALTKNARVSINWWGQRMVTVKGYEGAVRIDEFATTLLRNAFYSLSTREVWDNVTDLYRRSDRVLARTWVYKYIVAAVEIDLNPCLACAGNVRAKLAQRDGGCRRDWFTNTMRHEPSREVRVRLV